MKWNRRGSVCGLLAFSLFIILISACAKETELSDAYYDEEYQLHYEGRTYVYVGPAAGLKKDKKIAEFIDDDTRYRLYALKDWDSKEWLIVYMDVLMGDYSLYRESHMDAIPLTLSNQIACVADTTIEFENHTYQIYACMPKDEEVGTLLGTTGTKAANVYAMDGTEEFSWVAVRDSDRFEGYYLYRELHVQEVPIAFYEYARETYIDENGDLKR